MWIKKVFTEQWKPGPVDFVILAGAVVNLFAILAILAHRFFGG